MRSITSRRFLSFLLSGATAPGPLGSVAALAAVVAAVREEPAAWADVFDVLPFGARRASNDPGPERSRSRAAAVLEGRLLAPEAEL